MPIRAKVYEFDGTILGTYGGAVGLNGLIREARSMRLTLLSGVDSEDDTVFNAGQVRVLQAELRKILDTTSAESAPDARGLLDFSNLALEGTHRRLTFIGD